MRLTGLASGIDTEAMIKQLMAVERVKVDKVGQQKQVEEWRQNAYNDLNKELANFILKSKDDLGLTKTNSFGVTHNSSYRNATWVKDVVSSDENNLSGTATAESMNGVHTIQVDKLAQGVSEVSTKAITAEGKSKDSILKQFDGFAENDIMKFTIGGSKGDVTFIIGNKDKENEAKDTDAANNIIRIDKSLDEVSLKDIVSKINNASVNQVKDGKVTSTDALGIQAGYDSGLDKFFIKTKDVGSDSTLSFRAENGSKGSDFLSALELDFTGQTKKQIEIDGTMQGVYVATDAQIGSYKVDGIEFLSKDLDNTLIPIKYKSNNFTINGVSFTAKAEGVSSVTVSSNTEEVFNKVKEFVEGYNKIIDQMNSLVGEKRYKDFQPLTSEAREIMSDKEVELWEAKAKSGMLRGDEIVSRNLQRVRGDLYNNVEGVSGSYKHITDIGISTERYVSGAMGGKLEINEVKLKEMIERDAAGVMDLLFKQPTGELANDDNDLTSEQIRQKRNQSGIVTRIYDNLASGMKDIVDKAGLGNEASIIRRVRGKITSDYAIGGSKSRIDKQISEYNKRMDTLNRYLVNKENSYYRQFTAMEKAMQRANSQMGWLEQQFGGGM